MALTKLTITPVKKAGKQLVRDSEWKVVTVLFNPNSYSITKTVSWSPPSTAGGERTGTARQTTAPVLTFGGGGSRQLTLELFFDVTEPIDGIPVDDVRQETDKVVALTRIGSDQKPPPICQVAWGKMPSKDFPFIGVITNLTQRFTLFDSDGTPLRANLTVALTEFRDPELDQRETDPELTTRSVKRGDTLSSIAGEVYQDPTLWRIIAAANQIDNPRQIEPGQVLKIPKLS